MLEKNGDVGSVWGFNSANGPANGSTYPDFCTAKPSVQSIALEHEYAIQMYLFLDFRIEKRISLSDKNHTGCLCTFLQNSKSRNMLINDERSISELV